jgi:predicted metal-dependent phosphoesterase TrpH
VTAAAKRKGIRVIPGIEITAIDHGKDVHVLGYLFDPSSTPLSALLMSQRALRVMRVREIANRLASLNLPVDVNSVLISSAQRPGSSIGRPQLARELVRAGHVASVQEAFDKWLATGRPAYVPRTGPSPAEVIGTIHEAGGVASFAHPAVTNRDELIRPLVDKGLVRSRSTTRSPPEDVIEYNGLATRPACSSPAIQFSRRRRQPSARVAPSSASTLPAADLAALEKSASAKATARQARE